MSYYTIDETDKCTTHCPMCGKEIITTEQDFWKTAVVNSEHGMHTLCADCQNKEIQ